MQRTDFPFELCIGEDRSTDDTRKICISYAQRFPEKIRLFLRSEEEKKEGSKYPPGRWNSHLTRQACRGKYIAICEGDDYWTDESKLMIQVAFMEKMPGYVGCFTNYMIVDRDGQVMKERARGPSQPSYYDRVSVLRSGVPQTCSVMYKNILLKDPIFLKFLNVVNGDQVLAAIMGQNGKIGYIEKVSAARRVGSGTFSTLARSKQYLASIDTFMLLKMHLARSDEQRALNDRIEGLYLNLATSYLIRGCPGLAWRAIKARNGAIRAPRRSVILYSILYILKGAKDRISFLGK